MDVDYCLDIFRDFIDAGGGNQIPGLMEIRGVLQSAVQVGHLMEATDEIRLHLDNGMSVKILLTDSHGSFVGSVRSYS